VIDRLTYSDKLRVRYLRTLAFAFVLLPVVCLAQAPPPYTISTFAGTYTSPTSTTLPTCPNTSPGDGGAATSAQLCGPFGLAFDSTGNLYIADSNNERIRKISGGTITTVAGNGTAGFSGDGAAATSAELNSPSGVTFDSGGNMYIADSQNYEIRKVSGSTIATVAGQNSQGSGFMEDQQLGAATLAQLGIPSSVAVDSSGNIYFADPPNNIVSVVCENQTPVACTTAVFGSVTFAAGDINVFAGNQPTGCNYTGDGGLSISALLCNPIGVTLDPAGNLYIVDSDNHAIRKVTPSGVISTVAGSGLPGYTGDGGLAILATLNTPKGVAVDAANNIYIADSINCVIRMVEANGIITTIAGNQSAGPGYSGDGGPATSAQMFFPSDVAVNGGKVYISDTQNNLIRVLTPAPVVPQINAGGVITAGSFGASATVAPGSWVEIYGTNLAGDTRTWQTSDFNGSTAPTSLDFTSVTIGGQSAFVDYISPTQVNVQIPSNVSAGTQPLILTTEYGTSAAYNLTVATTAPGMYAPTVLNIGGNQYVGALYADSPSTWVLPTGAVSGFTSQPAAAGDTIVMYGVGFGTVTPASPAGQIVSGQDSLTSPVQFLFGTTPGTVTYQGLAPGLVGLYQFNVMIPSGVSGNLVPVTFSQGGTPGTQTLYTAIAAQ